MCCCIVRNAPAVPGEVRFQLTLRHALHPRVPVRVHAAPRIYRCADVHAKCGNVAAARHTMRHGQPGLETVCTPRVIPLRA